LRLKGLVQGSFSGCGSVVTRRPEGRRGMTTPEPDVPAQPIWRARDYPGAKSTKGDTRMTKENQNPGQQNQNPGQKPGQQQGGGQKPGQQQQDPGRPGQNPNQSR